MNIYEKIWKLTESEESRVTGIDSLLKGNSQFRYQMLSRMKSDCDYYLGYGNRNERDLWANSVEKQLDYMQKIYDSFSDDMKPEWLTQEDINRYRKEMLSGDDNGEEYHIKNPTVIEDKTNIYESSSSKREDIVDRLVGIADEAGLDIKSVIMDMYNSADGKENDLDKILVNLLDTYSSYLEELYGKDKLTEEESDTSRLKKLIKDLPDEVMYKGKKYVAYQVMLPDTAGENTAIYYCNPKSMPSGDPQEADDYFFVMAKLNKTDNGYKGVKEISYVEDLTESLDDVNYAIEKINKNLKSLDNNEDIDYEVHADFSDFPRIIRSIDKNSRLKAFMMLYMSNPKISELNSWNLDNLIDYIKETDTYYDRDKKYIDMCISLIK